MRGDEERKAGLLLLRWRAKLGLRLIALAERVLAVPDHPDEDWDHCSHCGAAGCEDGTAEHAPACPVETDVHVVTLQEMRFGGPAVCEGCGTTLWPGARYSHIWLEPIDGIPVGQVACLGCVAAHELLGG